MSDMASWILFLQDDFKSDDEKTGTTSYSTVKQSSTNLVPYS